MNSLSAQLLKQLEPAVRPGFVRSSSTISPRPSIESQGFEQLLALAKQGQIQSGRQIETAFDPTPPLTALQLERLGAAADQAEVAGAKRALMLIDGRGFVMDVQSRTLVAELSSDTNAAIQSIDAAVFVPTELTSPARAVKLPGNGLVPPGVLKQLDTITHSLRSTN